MAYHIDPYDGSLVIDGVEKGIADNPFEGISDMRNVNIISVPDEASVQFSTQVASNPASGALSVASVDTALNTITLSANADVTLDGGMAVYFSGTNLPAPFVVDTPYWITNLTNGFKTTTFYSDYTQTSLVDITTTGTVGNFTITPYKMATPKHFSYDNYNNKYWMVDSDGKVWTNKTVSGLYSYWIYSGNAYSPLAGGSHNLNGINVTGIGVGNGLVFYQSSNSSGTNIPYLFVFRNGLIDYTRTDNSFGWVYGWNPNDGTTANTAFYLKTNNSTTNSHEAKLIPDSRVYYCDANWIGRFYQLDPTVYFVPTTKSTYVFDTTQLLPINDIANCMEFLGTNLMVGGQKNIIYPWNRVDTKFNYPIYIGDNNIVKMLTVNTNTFILAGSRGRIYYTSGAQAQLYKKIPDHISGVPDPYFTWGGITFSKNQLYFSLKATDNSGTAIAQYGGVWAIDLDSKALRLVNKLSYGTYAGYASALISITDPTNNPAGTGLYMGWDSGASTYGLDTSSSTPYVASQATIDSDLIPIGTFTKRRNFERIEYRLRKPLVSGESISVKYRLDFSQSYTTIFTDSTVGNFSNSFAVNFKNAQWVQFQIVLNSTASTPSYVLFREIRVTGIKQ